MSKGLIQTYTKEHIFSDPRPFARNSYRSVADASLELVVSSEMRHETQDCGNVPLGARKDPPSDCSYVCHKTLNGQFQQPFAFEIFIYPALSLLPKFTKKLIKITTNKFSFPQVQVLNGSQKPSKLGMQWIYRRYYCTWPPEFSLGVNHQHEEIKFASLGSHARSFLLYGCR